MTEQDRETIEVVRNIQGGVDMKENLRYLYNRYIKMFVHIVERFENTRKFKINKQQREDFFADVPLTIYNSAMKFDPSKNITFTTYLHRAIQFSFYRIWKKEFSHSKYTHFTTDDPGVQQNSHLLTPEKSTDSTEYNILKDKAFKVLDINELIYFNARYVEGYNINEISHMMNVYRHNLYRLDKSVIEKLRA